MKRIVMLTAAALMISGTTSLSLAGEHGTESKPTPSVQSQPVVNTAPGAAKQAVAATQEKAPATVSNKSEVQPVNTQPAVEQKVAQGAGTMTEKKDTPASSTTVTPESKEKKAEQKPQETHTRTHPAK